MNAGVPAIQFSPVTAGAALTLSPSAFTRPKSSTFTKSQSSP
jgi:hypothetical protein